MLRTRAKGAELNEKVINPHCEVAGIEYTQQP